MEHRGNDALLKNSRATEWTINNGGYTSMLFAGFLVLGCISAYIIAVARGNVDAFLPLISDAAGSPPQNGIFGTLISIGGMFGVIFMFLRYMIVMEKNRDKSRMILFLNKLSFTLGVISMCGITLVTGYPINFYRNRDVWETDVGIPHMIGGVMLFALGIIYIAIQCILTLFLKPRDTRFLMTRIGICIICTTTFVYHLVTVPDNFQRIAKVNVTGEDLTTVDPFELVPETLGASRRLAIDTGGNYIASAVTEWILVLFFCGFFLTFFKETQEYSLLVVIETQFPEVERTTDLSQETKKMSEKDASSSEVRTVFRRDSTCQTMDDSEDVIITPSAKVTSHQNGKYTKRQVSSFELLAGDKLEKLIEKTMKSKTKESNENGSNGVRAVHTNTSKSKIDTVTEGIKEYLENAIERGENKAPQNGGVTEQVEMVDRGC